MSDKDKEYSKSERAEREFEENRRVERIPAKEPTGEEASGKKRKVAAYCRVSTDSEEQMKSYVTQKKAYTTSCVISFVDLYQKVRRNFSELQALTYEQKMELGKQMAQIAGDCGMTLRPCAEGNDLEPYGADCGGCMTVALYEKALGCHLNAPKRRN